MGIFDLARSSAPHSGLASIPQPDPATDPTPSGELAQVNSIFGLAAYERRITVVEEVRGLASVSVEAVRPAHCPYCGR